MLLPLANMQVVHWNPGATMPLVIPISLECNTPDDDVRANIRANSDKYRAWLDAVPAHDGIAILCGSGPSLADSLKEIEGIGGTVFALNGAARFLYANGIMPDYQVMLDPRPESADLVGPAEAHLMASACSPETLGKVANPTLFHIQAEGMDDLLPDDGPDCVMLLGSATVGNTALGVAFALGFRDIRCYGYDSSHRDDKGHAFAQPLNDGDPCAYVTWKGKNYLASFTMKMQAEKFGGIASALKDAGCKVSVHGSGLLPDIYNSPPSGMSERDKYEAMWGFAEYRVVSPGQHSAEEFVRRFGVTRHETVIDFGCGTGRGGLSIAERAGCYTTLVDFTENSRDEQAKQLPFLQADLSKPMHIRADYGYCADVMEHIPPEQVHDVLINIMACVPTCLFRIDFNHDSCGALIGETLHLSVHDHQWWLDTFMLLGMGVEWSSNEGNYGLYHVVRQAIDSMAAE